MGQSWKLGNTAGNGGVVLGGKIVSLRGLEAATVGSTLGVVTNISSGVDWTSEQQINELGEQLDGMVKEGMKALILDLRGNPGGLLTSAIQVSEMFLDKGDLIVSTKGRENVHPEVTKTATERRRYKDLPIAILVNGGTASASEIVAGALQDHRVAVLIGEQTYGKGAVQSIIECRSEEETAIRLTTAYYYTPSGRLIHKVGIAPDISLSIPPAYWRRVQVRRSHIEMPDHYSDEEKQKYADVVDEQLERAVDVLHAVRVLDFAD